MCLGRNRGSAVYIDLTWAIRSLVGEMSLGQPGGRQPQQLSKGRIKLNRWWVLQLLRRWWWSFKCFLTLFRGFISFISRMLLFGVIGRIRGALGCNSEGGWWGKAGLIWFLWAQTEGETRVEEQRKNDRFSGSDGSERWNYFLMALSLRLNWEFGRQSECF